MTLALGILPGYARGGVTEGAIPETPLKAASYLANLALNLRDGKLQTAIQEEETTEAVTEPVTEEAEELSDEEWADPPVILSAIARLQARANSIYNNLAITNVKSYVNIRSIPSEEGEILGKIYNNAAATILDTVSTETGDWYKIKSGTVEGYMAAKYFLTGSEAEMRALEVGLVTATVKPSSLRLRESADLGSATITVLAGGTSYVVEEQGLEFSKISVDSDIEGYVQNDYIDITVSYEEAISLEEEAARIAEQKKLEEAARAAAEKLRKEQEAKAGKTSKATTGTTAKATTKATEATTATTAEKTVEKTTEKQTEATLPSEQTVESEETKATDSSEAAGSGGTDPDPGTGSTEAASASGETETESTEAGSSSEEPSGSSSEESSAQTEEDDDSTALREAIVAEALQYVGVLKYVLGGNSLTTGTDCSGFVKLIYAKFGIKLPRVSDSQGTCGTAVSQEDMRPGDLIYYGGHIGIYIGDGKVCHCSTSKSWPNTKISTWNYRAVKSIRNVIGD